jgi:hypothetical protein
MKLKEIQNKKMKIWKNWKQKSPLVLENLMLEFQPTHGKKGRGSTIITKETRTIVMQEE